ncbi:MAG: tetratricopeptide repeat protein [Planctomycetes bacterium]|nr:tetratricopeptide repeat protein [Planctomycetota bacterium]
MASDDDIDSGSDVLGDLQRRFPDFQPVRRPPTLYTLNGVGTAVYGRRDADPETHTYIKTVCFCVLFIPLLALRAYRVADAGGGGWFFLGREPLSSFARAANGAILGMLAVGGVVVALSIEANTPEGKARRAFDTAMSQIEDGDTLPGIRGLVGLARGKTTQRDTARAALLDCARGGFASATTDELERSIAALLSVSGDSKWRAALGGSLLEFAESAVDDEDKASTASSGMEFREYQMLGLDQDYARVVESASKRFPDSPSIRTLLAGILEARGDVDGLVALLDPHDAELHDDSARILGQVRLIQGRYDDAIRLLARYEKIAIGRQGQVRRSIAHYDEAWNREFELLQRSAPKEFVRKYESADPAEQQRLVVEYIDARLSEDSEIAAARLASARNAVDVRARLDLGLARLRRAQEFSNPMSRKEMLRLAEKTFLDLGSAAEDSDEYELFYGQVCYWLGNEAKGKALFEKLLTRQSRAVEQLLAVGSALREVGATTEARALFEEAYEQATGELKESVAKLRAVVSTETDEKIQWLERAGADSGVQVELAAARGQRAIEKGETDVALRELRRAATGYDEQPESAAMFNNSALVYSSLFELSGDPADHHESVRRLEHALLLDPSGTILLANAAHELVSDAVLELNEDRLSYPDLRLSPRWSQSWVFARTDEDWTRERNRLRDHPKVNRAIHLLEQQAMLAAKDPGVHRTLAGLQGLFERVDELKKIHEGLGAIEVDDEMHRAMVRKQVTGADRESRLEESSAWSERLRARLESLDEQKRAERCLLTEAWIESELSRRSWGGEVDAQALVEAAAANHANHPCACSRISRRDALTAVLSDALAEADREYAHYQEAARHILDDLDRLTLAARDPRVLTWLQQSSEARIVADALVDLFEVFPSVPGIRSWTLLEQIDPERARPLRALILKPHFRWGARIGQRLLPFLPDPALNLYWIAVADGDAALAGSILSELAAEGIPLP